jgi:hypothetical protein
VDFVARQLPVQSLAIVAVDSVNLKPPLGKINPNSDNLARLSSRATIFAARHPETIAPTSAQSLAR